VAYDTLLVERDAAAAIVTVNRPKALNALDAVTIAELLDCCAQVRADHAVHAMIITGAGERAFVAGADIAAMATMSALDVRAFARRGQNLMRELEQLPIPVIAAVNGFALGGGLELALACDLVLAASSAKFGQPEINLGIIPGFGGTQRLARRVGAAAARWMIYTGETIGAEDAQALGLVNRVVAPADLMPEAKRLAATLASKPAVAMQQAKAAINVGADINIEDGCRYEAEAFTVAFTSEDRVEGMRAFFEKRPPVFKGS
jgi:enoyl-CoA hydratase